MSFRLGLTGSIGMGKSTTARMFADLGCAVWDADAAVHRLYAPGGLAVEPIGALRPRAVGPEGVSRTALRDWIAEDPEALARIEAVVHPLVAQDRERFAVDAGADIIVFDIPLLFETGSWREMDGVAVVSAPAGVQRARVLGRPGMTEAQLDLILSRQMPDAEKRRRADWVIPTDSMDAAARAVQSVVSEIRGRHA